MTTTKVSYETLVAMNLRHRSINPGDCVALSLRSEQEGIYELCCRLRDIFTISFCFLPETIAVHPDHLAILQKQGRSLEVTVTETGAKLIGDLVDLLTLPTKVALIADETLDLFTAVASYTFTSEKLLKMVLGVFKLSAYGEKGPLG